MASIRKRILKSGAVVFQADYRDASGHRRHKQFPKRKDADRWLTKARSEVNAGTHVSDAASVTVKIAADSWITKCRLNKLEQSTLVGYEQHIDLHIAPFLGLELLSRLDTPDAERFYETLLENGRTPDMVRRVRITFGAIVTHAQSKKWVGINFIKLVPFKVSKRANPRPPMPTKDEFNSILKHTPADWRAFILTDAFAGLRSSELRGLPWSDVDFTNSMLHVTQRADRWGKIGFPKSEAGTREVEVPPAVIKALREWKVRCPKGELGLVFPNGAGRVESHSNIMNRYFYVAQIAANVTKNVVLRDRNRKPVLDGSGRTQLILRAKYGLHAIRHFCASLWIEAGFSPKKVQVLMGHKSIVQTFDIYGHLFERRDRDHAKVLEIQRSVLGK